MKGRQVLYWKQAGGSDLEHEARSGDRVDWRENARYYLRFPDALSKAEAAYCAGLGFEVIDEHRVVVSFRNFVGRTNLRGVTFEVKSWKLGPQGVSALLGETVELASTLVYGWGSPLGFAVRRASTPSRRVPFHDFMLVRHEMLMSRPGGRLQDHFALVAERPTRRLCTVYEEVPTARLRRVDRQGWRAVVSNTSRLVRLEPGHPLYDNPVAAALSLDGQAGSPRLMPSHVRSARRITSHDTPENRFVRHLVRVCSDLVGRFLEHPKLHAGLRADARTMFAELEVMRHAPFLSGVGLPGPSFSPSQGLLKLDGYRELLDVYRALMDSPSLPQSNDECVRFLDGRDVATLYEYWVFLRVVQALCSLEGSAVPKIVVVSNDVGALLPKGLSVTVGRFVASYNRSFKGRSSVGSYSTPLKPDVTVEFDDRVVVLDAKYRMERLDVGSSDDEDETPERLWKKVDLYKMHTYRDALHQAETALVVYPGDHFSFFQEDCHMAEAPGDITLAKGVGAIPLRPGQSEHQESLVGTLARLTAV